MKLAIKLLNYVLSHSDCECQPYFMQGAYFTNAFEVKLLPRAWNNKLLCTAPMKLPYVSPAEHICTDLTDLSLVKPTYPIKEIIFFNNSKTFIRIT